MNLIVGLVLLGAAYGFGSLAIDTGRWLFYFLTLVALIFAVRYILKFIKHNGRK